MNLSGPDWIKLNRLLDEALDLEPQQRSGWMDALPPEYASLRETLRDLLLRQGVPETSEVLRRAPLPQAPMLKSNDIVGPWRLIRQIGAGGMATVWLAERADGSLQRQVALKLPQIHWIDRDLSQWLHRERDILASLEHPGIARLYDAGVDEAGRAWLAIEYVDGVSLDQYVRQYPLSLRQRLALFEQVARAVVYAHAHLVVHRDLKPTNILVNGSGEVRLLDFGIARLLDQEAHAAPAAIRVFTPQYAAPEQFSGEPPTVATDVYSLGVILYELLAGRSPYPPPGRTARDPQILCLDPAPISAIVDRSLARELRGDLEAILLKALQPVPAQRYGSVAEFMEDIQRYRRSLPVRAHVDSRAYRIGKFLRRHRMAIGVSGALLAVIVAGAGVSMWQAQLALRERDRALRLYEELETRNELWNMVMTEGFASGESISMTELLARSEQMAEKAFAGSPYQYAVATDAIAALYMAYGMDAQAHTLTGKGLARIEQVDEGPRAASFRCSYAVAIDALGRAREADEMLAATIDQVANEPDLKQYCLQCRFYVAHHNNDAAAALEYIQEAYRLSQQYPTQSASKSATMLGELASAYALNGQTDLAHRHYEEAMRRFRTLGREEGRGAFRILSGWATVGTNSGNPAAALERFDQAIAIQRQHSPTGQPALSMLGNRANALASLGRFDEALRDYEQMRAGGRAEWGSGVMIYALGGMADIHLTRGDLPGAEILIASITAEDRSKVSASSAAALRLLVVEGRILTRQGRLTEAYDKLTHAIAMFDSGAIVVGGRSRVYTARAELLVRSSRFAEALADAQRAVDIASAARGEARYSNFLGLAALVRGEIELQMNDKEAAARSLRLAVDNFKGTVDDQHPDAQRAQALLQELSMA